MEIIFMLTGTLVPILLMGWILFPAQFLNRHKRLANSIAEAMILLALVFFGICLASLFYNDPTTFDLFRISYPFAFSAGIRIEPVTILMANLICFIGLIITRFSFRYLDGDPGQGRFIRNVCFTLGSVLLLVLSNNLALTFAGWLSTSLGLHLLLNHYPERNWAVWAARKKFLVSRVGDGFFLCAIFLTYHCFGTLDYTTIFEKSNQIRDSGLETPPLVTWVGLFLVLAAMTKSAQFPFHTWLPDTMETPTPVSALMHAGVINAGGFLVIRLSPLVTLSPMALDILAIVGSMTALMGSLLMLTQTSIKRSLAYSTIAQMGFMMLQCGLGAFIPALLHILAHSFYKAHAFLSSGGILESANASTLFSQDQKSTNTTKSLLLSLATSLVLCFGTLWLMGSHSSAKPGTIILGFILVLALTQLIWPFFASGNPRLAFGGLMSGLLVCASYVIGYQLIFRMTSGGMDSGTTTTGMLGILVFLIVTVGFLSIFILQALMIPIGKIPFMRALYVHALNGFYLDIPSRRIAGIFWGKSSPVP